MYDYLTEQSRKFMRGRRLWRVFWLLLFAYVFLEMGYDDVMAHEELMDLIFDFDFASLCIWRAGLILLNRRRAKRANEINSILRTLAQPVCSNEEIRRMLNKQNAPEEMHKLIAHDFLRGVKYHIRENCFVLHGEEEPPAPRHVQCPSCGAAASAVPGMTNHCPYCGAVVECPPDAEEEVADQ